MSSFNEMRKYSICREAVPDGVRMALAEAGRCCQSCGHGLWHWLAQDDEPCRCEVKHICPEHWQAAVAAANTQLTALKARAEAAEGIEELARKLVAVRAEFAGVSMYMPPHPGNEFWSDKFMAAYRPLEAALSTKVGA